MLVDGISVPSLTRRELYQVRARLAYVFQFAALFDSMSVGDNVAMGLRKQTDLTPAEIEARVHEALELVDLPDVADLAPCGALGRYAQAGRPRSCHRAQAEVHSL